MAFILGLQIKIFTLLLIFGTCYSDLPSSSVIEMACPLPSTITIPANINPVFALQPLNCNFLPMASPFLYRNLAEVFLGRPAIDQSELNAMQYHGATVLSAENQGYTTKFFAQICWLMNSPYQAYCVPGPIASLGANTTYMATIIDTFVWTNNQDGILITRCTNGVAYAWGFCSVTKTVPESVKQEVLAKVQSLGFDPANAQYMSYTGII